MFLQSGLLAGPILNDSTLEWLRAELPEEAFFIENTIEYSFATYSYNVFGGSSNRAFYFFSEGEKNKNIAAIVKYIDRLPSREQKLGVSSKQALFRGRLAYLLGQVFKEEFDIDFGLLPTALLNIPHPGASLDKTFLASFHKYEKYKPWNECRLSVIEKIPQSEFQKLIFHVLIDATNGRKSNILLKSIQDENGEANFTPVVVDLEGSLPLVEHAGHLKALYGWMMYPAAMKSFTTKWKQIFESMDTQAVIAALRAKWEREADFLGVESEDCLPEEVWDLLQITLGVVKLGAKYDASLQAMASFFLPVREFSYYYRGGEIEDWVEDHFDEKTRRWSDIEVILQKVEAALDGSTERKFNSKKRFLYVDDCQI